MKRIIIAVFALMLCAGVFGQGSKNGIEPPLNQSQSSGSGQAPAQSQSSGSGQAVETGLPLSQELSPFAEASADKQRTGVPVSQEQGSGSARTVNQSQSSGSQQTVKTEQQAPGVMVEHREDGTKVVTINLSEVDEESLPEKYEAKVILEAPVYQLVSGNRELYFNNELLGKFERDSTFKLNRTNITRSGTFIKGGVDNYPDGIDVKIDGAGNIYILDMYNGRIQKFNSEGKHIRDIPIKDNFEFGGTEGGRAVRAKEEISVGSDRVYVRDTKKNKIEALDESGKVLETIDVPEEIGGKKTREMRMWADEEGVGVGEVRIRRKGEEGGKTEHGKIKENRRIEIREINKQKRQIIFGNININVISKRVFLRLDQSNLDGKNNTYFSISTGEREGTAVYKLSADGTLIAKIPTWPYHTLEKWKAGCENFFKVAETARWYDRRGNIYVLHGICCRDNACNGKIRVIKLTSTTGE